MATKKKQKDKVLPSDTGFISQAVLRNVKISPRKARLVIDLIRGKAIGAALETLMMCDKKTAPVLRKLLLSAAANAKNASDVNVDELFIKKAWVDEARKLKRFMPRAQGRATPIFKRHSHITVILDEVR